MDRVAAGQRAALRPLFEATVENVFTIAVGVLHDPGLADDAVAETFLHVWRLAARYDSERAPIGVWIAMIARSRAVDLKRRRTAQREDDVENLAAVVDEADHPISRPRLGATIDAAARTEVALVVRRALDSLSHDQRQAVECAFYGGLTHAEVARCLGAPLGTIKTRIRSGLTLLRERLGSLEPELGMLDRATGEGIR